MLPETKDIYFLLLALLAEVLGTVGGFGSSLFFVPIATYFFDFHTALGITAVFHVLSNLTKITLFREGVDRSIIIKIGVPAVIGVIIGAFAGKYIRTDILELALALFLVATSVVFLSFQQINVEPSTQKSIWGGAFSGFIAGLIGTGGAVRGLVLAAFNLPTNVFIATSAFIDLGIDLSRSVVYTLNGYVRFQDLFLMPYLLLISFAGNWIGKKILNKITNEEFKKLVLILILLTGIFTIYKSLTS